MAETQWFLATAYKVAKRLDRALTTKNARRHPHRSLCTSFQGTEGMDPGV
jgi:hypothetical protein